MAEFIQAFVEFAGHGVMRVLARGLRKIIKTDVHAVKDGLDERMVFGHMLLGRDAARLGADGDGNAVVVRAAHVNDIGAAHAVVAHKNVRGHVCAGDVSEMNGPVCVWQG